MGIGNWLRDLSHSRSKSRTPGARSQLSARSATPDNQSSKTKGSSGGSSSATPAKIFGDERHPVTKSAGLDPWSLAFAELRDEDRTAKLVETFLKILTHRANPSKTEDQQISEDAPNQFDRLEEAEMAKEIDTMLKPLLAKYREEKWWKKAADGADMVVSKMGKVMGDALHACPPAAFAWSAICITVPILVQPIKQEKSMADGLEYVLEQMDWFMTLTKVVMKPDWPEDHPFKEYRKSTATKAVRLFKAMLQFEMECACRAYHKHPVVGVVKDMIRPADWEKKLATIKELDKRISGDFRHYQLSRLTEDVSQMAENTEDLLVEVRQMRLRFADVKQFEMDEKLAKLISRFGATNYLEQMRLNPEKHPGTCQWFRGHAKYRGWLKSSHNDLLLVTAEPGCGKSVLSRFLVERDLPSRQAGGLKPVVCYFFFKDNPIQRSLANGLAAITHQLLMGCEDAVVTEFARKINSMSDEMLKGLDTLWSLFETVSSHEAFEGRTIYCIFDALDECDKEDREKLVDFLRTYRRTKRRIRFLVTSRPYPSIVEAFWEWTEKPMTLEGEGDEEKRMLQKEIDIVFQHKIDSLVERRKLSGPVTDLLREKLLAKGAGQRTYLWVRLVFELLKRVTPMDLNDWRIYLDDLPEGVPGAYDKLLSDVSPRHRERVSVLLHIIYIAYRPLTLREANIAVQIRGKYDDDSRKSLEPDDKSFRAWLKKECGFFITEYDDHLYFIHQTAREFLRSQPIQTDSAISTNTKPNETWRNSIKSDEDAHFQMAECCVAGMMVAKSEERLQSSLYDYAARNWGHHVREGVTHQATIHCRDGSTRVEELSHAVFNLVESKDKVESSARKLFDDDVRDWTGLHLGAYFGLGEAVRFLVEKGAAFDTPNDYGRTPLSYAAESGHEAVVRILVEKGAALDTPDGDGQTPLSYAAESGHEAVVRILVEKGAALDTPDRDGRTPLSWAAAKGYEAVVRVLVEKGAALNTPDDYGQTPLLWAAADGHEAVVRVLVEKGAALDTPDGDGRTPLWYAAASGHEAVVEVLQNPCRWHGPSRLFLASL